MPVFRPIRHFLAWLVPGQAVSMAVAALAAASTPALAPAVLLSLGFLAFAVAVSAAARPPQSARADGRQDAVLAVLDLRRNRGRYALVFAGLGVVAGGAALVVSGLAGMLSLSFGHGLLALALGFVSAWLILGEAACSQAVIRQALLGKGERT